MQVFGRTFLHDFRKAITQLAYMCMSLTSLLKSSLYSKKYCLKGVFGTEVNDQHTSLSDG